MQSSDQFKAIRLHGIATKLVPSSRQSAHSNIGNLIKLATLNKCISFIVIKPLCITTRVQCNGTITVEQR